MNPKKNSNNNRNDRNESNSESKNKSIEWICTVNHSNGNG